jgi:hypothetical protein
MLLPLIHQLGGLNPQLFRELKGRLKPRSVWLTIGCSVFVQIVLLKVFLDQLPREGMTDSAYCLLNASQSCLQNEASNLLIDWPKWWQGILRVFNWSLPFILTVPSVYLLIMDVQQEESRGTLNFVRLSPQSARSILLGKLFGVPALVYLGVATLLPMYLIATIGAGGAALAFLLSYAVLIGAGSYVLFSVALLIGCLTKPQAAGGQFASGASLLAVLAVIFAIVPLYLNWNLFTAWDQVGHYLRFWYEPLAVDSSSDLPQWFYLSLKQPLFAHVFTLGVLGLANHWVWQALTRHFHTPNRTLLAKRQSYLLVACSQILMLGFCCSRYWQDGRGDSIALLIAICFVNVVWFLWLTLLLSPTRQTVMDWARYRSESPTEPELGGRQSLLQALLWNDKSPAVLAVGVNLLLASLIMVPWILSFSEPASKWGAIAGLIFNITLLTLYALLIQATLLAKTPKRATLAISTVALAIVAAPLLAAFLSLSSPSAPPSELLLFSPFFWVALQQASAFTIGLSLLAQWGAIALLGVRLTQTIHRLGASESQALLSGTTSNP